MGRSHNKHNSQSLRLEIQDQGTGSVGGWELMYWVVDATSHDLTWHKGESSVVSSHKGTGPIMRAPPSSHLLRFHCMNLERGTHIQPMAVSPDEE